MNDVVDNVSADPLAENCKDVKFINHINKLRGILTFARPCSRGLRIAYAFGNEQRRSPRTGYIASPPPRVEAR